MLHSLIQSHALYVILSPWAFVLTSPSSTAFWSLRASLYTLPVQLLLQKYRAASFFVSHISCHNSLSVGRFRFNGTGLIVSFSVFLLLQPRGVRPPPPIPRHYICSCRSHSSRGGAWACEGLYSFFLCLFPSSRANVISSLISAQAAIDDATQVTTSHLLPIVFISILLFSCPKIKNTLLSFGFSFCHSVMSLRISSIVFAIVFCFSIQ